jgi:hypothetical protein
MAVTTKQYLDLTGLSAYDQLIKAWVNGSSSVKSEVIFRTVLYDSDNIYFYHKANATSSDTADVTVPLAGSDVTKALAEISALVNGLGGSMASTAPYTVSFPALSTEAKNTLVAAINEVDAHADAAQADVNALETFVGAIPKGATATTVTGYVDEKVGALDDSLATVAKTGDASNVTYSNTTSGLTATDVQAAIDEVVDGLGTAAAADIATSAITKESTDNNLVSAAQVSAFVAQEIAGLEGAMHFRGTIERQAGESDAQAIARVITDPEAGDVVVMSDNAKEYVYDGTAWKEVGDETEFVKKTTTIAGVDLQDNITKIELLSALNVEDGAEVNIVETVQVNGSALTPDANRAVNVTVAEGSTDGTVAVNGADVAVHGLGSAAYTASTAYDAAGTAAAAIEALDTRSDVAIATYDSTNDTIALVNGISETDGLIGAGTGDGITIGAIPTASINRLFTVTTP